MQIVYTTPIINGKTYTIINQNFNFEDFKDFALKSFDDGGVTRFNDTELKYVFHFLETHWSQGNSFKIRIESVLYNCTSCQRYMQALKNYGAKNGKIIDIEFSAHPEAERIIDIQGIDN